MTHLDYKKAEQTTGYVFSDHYWRNLNDYLASNCTTAANFFRSNGG